MGHESRIIAVAGQHASEAAHLPEIGTRVLALLRELAAHRVSYVRLQFEAGAILGAMIGRHCLFAFADGGSDDDAFLAVIDEVRAILADHDLAAIPIDSPAAGAGRVTIPEVAAPAPAADAPAGGCALPGSLGAKAPPRRRRPFGR